MSVNEVRLNDVGTVFKYVVYDNSSLVNVSSATSKAIIFKKPDGTTLTKTGSFYTNGGDGIISYTGVSGDFDSAGVWQTQLQISMSGGTWRSDIKTFNVYENL